MVGITIASMMPSELNMMRRSAAAIGPFGSSTPSEQPPSATAAINRTGIAWRMSDPLGPGAGRERREQHEQVQDGKREQAVRRPPIRPAVREQCQRERNEDRPADGGCDAVHGAGKP